jgi:hypothetical protein
MSKSYICSVSAHRWIRPVGSFVVINHLRTMWSVTMVNGKTAKRDPVLLATLQAMIYFSELGKDAKPVTDSRQKTSRVLEVKTENQDEAEPEQRVTQQTRGNNWANRGGGRGGGRGSAGQGRGCGRQGRGAGMKNYMPNADRPSIMERKRQTNGNFCGKLGHWHAECRARIANEALIEQQQAAGRTAAA